MCKLLFISLFLTSCVTVKPYEKEFLVSPLLQQQLLPSESLICSQYEKFPQVNSVNATTACPTCGG